MKHDEDNLIRNNIPVVCYEIEGESELPFINNGKSYGYEYANICSDFTDEAYMGFCYGREKMSFDELKNDMMEKRVDELERTRCIVTSRSFFEENDEFYPEYERLSEIVSKYRRRRAGNPDVIKLNAFVEKHGGLKFEKRRYDIKYNSMLFNYYPEVVKEDNIVCRSSLVKKEASATLERRIEIANAMIDNEEDPIGLKRDYFSSDFEYMKDNYRSAIADIKRLLKKYKEVFLLYPQSGNSRKYVIPFVPKTINANLSAFTIEDYLYASPNTLYRFKQIN